MTDIKGERDTKVKKDIRKGCRWLYDIQKIAERESFDRQFKRKGERGESKRWIQKLQNIDQSFKYDKGEIHTKR